MANQVFYLVMPETSPVSSLKSVPTYVNVSFLDAVVEAIRLSSIAERHNPNMALYHYCYRIFECESDHRLRSVGHTVKTSDGWTCVL